MRSPLKVLLRKMQRGGEKRCVVRKKGVGFQEVRRAPHISAPNTGGARESKYASTTGVLLGQKEPVGKKRDDFSKRRVLLIFVRLTGGGGHLESSCPFPQADAAHAV